MKIIITVICFILFLSPNIFAQFNSVGYNAKTGEWNVGVHNLYYSNLENEPTRVVSFHLTIENKTTYILSAIDVEITFKNNGKPFFKKTCKMYISPPCGFGEIYDTEPWFFGNPLQ